MSNENSARNTHSKIVLDYSFCNSSNIWNYLGVITIILFIATLISFLKYRKLRHHHQKNYNSIYITVLIILGLFFVVPCMCWLLTLVEIFVTFIRYGRIAASPLPILSLPIQLLAFIYTKIISALHMYLTAPGTFVFLLFFMTLICLRIVVLIAVGYGLPGFFLCSWFGFSMPLYAITEVGSIDSWIDLVFTSQLPILIIYKFLPLLLAVRSLILWIFLFIVFLVAYYIKFGLTFLFVCKCLLIIVLVRFTYVIGKGFVALMFLSSTATNAGRTGDDVQ